MNAAGAPRHLGSLQPMLVIDPLGASHAVFGDTVGSLPRVLDPGDVSLYEDLGIDCLQIGEPNAKNQALLNRLRDTPLPVIHKRGNSLDMILLLCNSTTVLVVLCVVGQLGVECNTDIDKDQSDHDRYLISNVIVPPTTVRLSRT